MCEVVAQTLSSGRVSRLSIPVGLLSSGEFARCLEETVDGSQQGDTLSSLIIQGINRSALELFADQLISLVSDRQVAYAARAPNLVLLSSAVRGPGALPIPPSLCDPGPGVIGRKPLALHWILVRSMRWPGGWGELKACFGARHSNQRLSA